MLTGAGGGGGGSHATREQLGVCPCLCAVVNLRNALLPGSVSVFLVLLTEQIFTSQTTLGFTLKKATGLCNTLHNAVLHSSLVDKLFSTVDEVADLGILA